MEGVTLKKVFDDQFEFLRGMYVLQGDLPPVHNIKVFHKMKQVEKASYIMVMMLDQTKALIDRNADIETTYRKHLDDIAGLIMKCETKEHLDMLKQAEMFKEGYCLKCKTVCECSDDDDDDEE